MIRRSFILLLLIAGSFSLSAQQHIVEEINIMTFTYSDTLKLDFYSKQENINPDRPLLLLVHGGGFSGGKRDNPLEKKFAEEMASKGYAVASMSYRLSRKGRSFGCDCPAEEKIETFVMAAEDVTRALEFLQDRRRDLKFDPDLSVLVGSSAGAEAILQASFMNKHQAFKAIPKPDVAGLIIFSGAILNADFITRRNMVPIMMFHGMKDALVPYASASHHFCAPDKPGYLMLHGASTIASRLKELGGSFELVSDEKGTHAWANMAYKYTEEISRFIDEVIIGEMKKQEIIDYKPTN